MIKKNWHLRDKEKYCSCKKDACLRFLKCPSCGAIVLQCDKTGIIFNNPNDTSYVQPDNYVCHRCERHPIDHFGGVEIYEIEALGFSKEQIK
ncbi:MAG: hypothetical protein JXC36_06345 [Candidatus Atribacteria bacterium]|nr:hypothetical protein [Candidatus Atribacteria bacterium]